MKRETSWTLLWAVALCVASGCGASDGGPIGTGITSSVVGNVVEAPPSLQVSLVERPEVTARADEAGNFRLEGDFAGDLTLRFAADGSEFLEPILVPRSSVLALSDIDLDAAGVEVQAAIRLNFVARVEEVDCAGGRLAVVDLSGDPPVFEIDIGEETEIVRRDGRATSCERIEAGRRVTIEGITDPDDGRRLLALHVALGTSRVEPAEPSYAVPFSGSVVAIDCEGGSLGVANDFGRTSVVLDPEAKIERRGEGPIACADIALGDQAFGLGVLRLDDAGALRAAKVTVAAEPRRNRQVGLVGRIAAVDCASGALRLRYKRAFTDALLTAESEIEPDLACGDLRVDDRVSGKGRIRAAQPNVIEVVRLRRRASQGSEDRSRP
jgi:hypothetical protein